MLKIFCALLVLISCASAQEAVSQPATATPGTKTPHAALSLLPPISPTEPRKAPVVGKIFLQDEQFDAYNKLTLVFTGTEETKLAAFKWGNDVILAFDQTFQMSKLRIPKGVFAIEPLPSQGNLSLYKLTIKDTRYNAEYKKSGSQWQITLTLNEPNIPEFLEVKTISDSDNKNSLLLAPDDPLAFQEVSLDGTPLIIMPHTDKGVPGALHNRVFAVVPTIVGLVAIKKDPMTTVRKTDEGILFSSVDHKNLPISYAGDLTDYIPAPSFPILDLTKWDVDPSLFNSLYKMEIQNIADNPDKSDLKTIENLAYLHFSGGALPRSTGMGPSCHRIVTQ